MWAEIAFDTDLQSYATEAVVFLLVLGGLTFLAANLVLGQTPVSSDSARPRRPAPWQDPPAAAGPGGAESARPPAARPGRAGGSGSGKPSDRRGSLRRQGNPVDVLIADATDSGEPVAGVVVDRSRGGLRLSVSQPSEVGTVLRVRAVAAPEDFPWVQIRVKRCRQRGERWELGCQ